MTDDEIVEAMARAIHETGPFRDAPWASVAGPHRSECLAFARAALAVARPMIEGPLKEALRTIRRHNDSPVNYDEHIDALACAALGATDER
jgi:hypothetical protein